MITEGYIVRHYQGRSGGRDPALIDIAQDHLLCRLADRGLFELGIALKGGTAIRKFWAGSAGRFWPFGAWCKPIPPSGWSRPPANSSNAPGHSTGSVPTRNGR